MMKIQKVPQQKGTLAAFMNLVERVCNRLPPPAILFLSALCPDRPVGRPLYGNGGTS